MPTYALARPHTLLQKARIRPQQPEAKTLRNDASSALSSLDRAGVGLVKESLAVYALSRNPLAKCYSLLHAQWGNWLVFTYISDLCTSWYRLRRRETEDKDDSSAVDPPVQSYEFETGSRLAGLQHCRCRLGKLLGLLGNIRWTGAPKPFPVELSALARRVTWWRWMLWFPWMRIRQWVLEHQPVA